MIKHCHCHILPAACNLDLLVIFKVKRKDMGSPILKYLIGSDIENIDQHLKGIVRDGKYLCPNSQSMVHIESIEPLEVKDGVIHLNKWIKSIKKRYGKEED